MKRLVPLLLFFLCFCFFTVLAARSLIEHLPLRESGPPLTTVTLTSASGKSATFYVEIADSPEEQATGLMHRTTLDADRGMLFIFPDASPRFFWMKNTLIPLDIIFFDAGKNVVSSATMAPCAADPCPDTRSRRAAQYALELPAGTVQTLGLDSTWSIAW